MLCYARLLSWIGIHGYCSIVIAAMAMCVGNARFYGDHSEAVEDVADGDAVDRSDDEPHDDTRHGRRSADRQAVPRP